MIKKIALIGIGKIAKDQHIPAIAASPDWELAGTVSLEGHVEGVESFTSVAAMVKARPDIECISICVPPIPRFDFAVEAINAGRHVMLEKPPCATLAECNTLKAMARAKGVSIFAAWHSREAAFVDMARDWLADKQLKSLEIIWKEDVRRWHPGQKWIWQSGGLGVFDPGINALSILTKILPVDVQIASSVLSFPENCETPIAADITFHHPDGANVSAEFDFRQQGDQTWSMRIDTDGGQLLLEEGGAKLSLAGKGQTGFQEVLIAQDPGNPLLEGEYPRLYARMSELVQTGGVDMDLSPMTLVADCFLRGQRKIVEPFFE